MSQALKLLINGCAAGPAGCGKTESCKDFAQFIGNQAIVFNCSD